MIEESTEAEKAYTLSYMRRSMWWVYAKVMRQVSAAVGGIFWWE